MTVDIANLKWYYTSGSSSTSSAKTPATSVGGDRAGVIDSNTDQNLFPQVSGEQARDGINKEYIGVMFINEDSDEFGTPKMYSEDVPSDSNVILQFAQDNMNPSTSGELSVITSRTTAPTAIRAAFAPIPSSSGGAYAFAGLTQNKMAQNVRVGIWFSRKINAGASSRDPYQYTIKVVGEANV